MTDATLLEDELRRRAAAVLRRNEIEAAIDSGLFERQIAFIRDTSKRITNDSGRRSGKTHVISRRNVKGASKGERRLITSITKPYAVDLYWKELVKVCEALRFHVKLDNVRHEIWFDGGGLITLGGISTKDEREKARGKAWHEVTCDETGSFGPYLQYFMDDVLDATLADYDGTLVLAGTPSPTGVGYYADACHNSSWSHHHWTVAENPMLPRWAGNSNWQALALEFIAEKRAKLPQAKFEREYLGLWVRDLSALLVTLDNARNRYDVLPQRRWTYVMGIDTGSKDESAIVLLAVSVDTNEVYVIDEWSKAGVLIDDPKDVGNSLVGQIRRMARNYNPRMVIDPANKQLVDSMVQLYGLPLERADKQGKAAHIDILNTCAHQGLLKFPINSGTYDQSSTLEWDENRQREREGQPCDRFDALLYAFTLAHQENYWQPDRPAPTKPQDHPMAEENRRLHNEQMLAEQRRKELEQRGGIWTDGIEKLDPLDF